MVHCKICNSTSEATFRAKVTLIYGSEYDLVECSHCEALFFSPLPSVEVLTLFYSGGYFDFNAKLAFAKGKSFAKKLNTWKPTGRFLDIGCATGYFLKGIKDHSAWDVCGTDFGSSAIAHVKDNLGIEAYCGDITEMSLDDASFDYIHVNNVLEHVLDPASFLKTCHRLLKDNGRLYLSVPNGFVDSRDLIDFYKEENLPARSLQGHIYFLPKKSLLTLFENRGFKIETAKTYGIKRGLRSLGYLKRKKNWKESYRPLTSAPTSPETQRSVEVKVQNKPDLYFDLRIAKSNLSRLPGLHKVGLDYLFLLSKADS